MWCADHDDLNLTNCTMRTWDHACINSRVEVHVRCVGRCSGSWWSRCHWCRASCRSVSPRIRNAKCRVLSFWILWSSCALVVKLYSVIVNSICNRILAHFYIAKAGHLRCCLYAPRRLQKTAVSCKRSFCNKIN